MLCVAFLLGIESAEILSISVASSYGELVQLEPSQVLPRPIHSIDISSAIVEPNQNPSLSSHRPSPDLSALCPVTAIAPVRSVFTMLTGMIWAWTPSRPYYTLSEATPVLLQHFRI
ncbi:hypothetical protein EV363DRAFT_883648 [Boletus edulis]|nr:hypothetical protein EV363DRAFT_883648 [Boletus edulis]